MTIATRRAVVLLIVVVSLVVISLAFFTPFYQTNDDIAMRLLAEGNFVPGDEPVPFLMFINIIIGKILATAYSLAPSLPWYDLFLGGSLVVATATIVYCWLGSATPAQIGAAVLSAAFFLLPAFVSVQFSVPGMTCAAAGLALLLDALLNSPPLSKSRQLRWTAGAALFVLGSLIRFEGAVLIAIQCALISLPAIIAVWRDETARPRLKGAALAGVVAVVLAGSLFALNQFAYRANQGWKDFYEFNRMRSRLNEYITPERLRSEAAEQLVTQVGWSKADFLMFRNWFFTDRDLYSLAKVRKAESLFYSASNKPVSDRWEMRKARASDLAKNFLADTRWAFLLMAIYVLAFGARPKMILHLLWVAIVLVLLIVGIGLTLKAPPQRISWPMVITAATMLIVVTRRWQRPLHWSIPALAALAAVYAAVPAFRALDAESHTRSAAAESARQDVVDMRRTGAKTYVLHGNAFPYEDYWQPLHRGDVAFDFVGLGVSAQTPPVVEYLSRTKRTDLPWSLCSDPSMAMIARPYIRKMLENFVLEHHRTEVSLEPAFEGTRFTVWKCRPVSTGG